MGNSNNLPSVTVDTFAKIVEMQIQEKNFRPIFGLGKGGIGKSESIMELTNKLGIGYIDIRLLLYSETDLKGIPYPDETHTKTIWLQNNTLPIEERDGKQGILVLDEITSASRSVRTAAYQLLNERKLGEYRLPDGWIIVCLGNGEEDGGDYQGMEGNFANRCSVFNVVSDVESWKKWAVKHEINPLVLGYVSFKPSDLHSYNPENETELLFASPRSWKAVSDILNNNEFSLDNKILTYRIIASVGQRVGRSFLAFCKFKNQAVDPMDIVKNGTVSQVENQEIIYITIQSIVKIVGDMVMNDVEYNNGTITPDSVKALANGLRWILAQRKEYAVMGFKDLIAYDETVFIRLIMNKQLHAICPELKAFANENAAIFS